ncbi:MAG TPA: hypothetical protein VGX03_35925, partial [Candidatus Binatia bacterium]|nr:hypothetical protein [Candidatus Binatia bacterium]
MERVGVVVGLAAGVLIGYNWPTIRKTVGPAMEEVGNQVSTAVIAGLRYVVELKESYEDRLAEARARKEATPEAAPTGTNDAPAEG